MNHRWTTYLLSFLVAACCSLIAFTTNATAAPQWSIEMTHANAYGLQVAACPAGHEVYVPSNVEADCGVDPNTGSGTTFAQESGFNTYTITVTNTAAPSAGPTTADVLSCEEGEWFEGPSFGYAWFRNGTLIAGAESNEYTLAVADEGSAVQCQVTATNTSGTAVAVTNPIAVSPSQPAPLPELEAGSKVSVAGESGTFPVGATLPCEHGSWTGNPTFSYHWLRNGLPIAGAEAAAYTLTASDEDTAVQCEIIAASAGGSVVADNEFFTYVGAAEPSPYPPYFGRSPAIPIPISSQATTGPATVADRLPEGLHIAGTSESPAAFGAGWQCDISTGATGVSCTNPTSLSPGASFPPLVLRTRVGPAAPVGSAPSGGVTNTATVAGGGAGARSVIDPTVIAPAVGLGVQQFSTSVSDPLGNPLTQSGSHPLAAHARFVLNYATSDVGELETAGGIPKVLATELPPGFIGDPQNVAQCTTQEALLPAEAGGRHGDNECPAESVVGFVDVQLGGLISGGKTEPFAHSEFSTTLVYNREPSPGNAAEFGFTVEHAAFSLVARLRSNGNYGVTVLDTASGRAASVGVLAVDLTLCGYGVTGQPSEGSTPATAACAAPTAGSKPFLTMPTRCSGPPPVTTLVASTYQAPLAYVSKTVYNGANLVDGTPSPSESFVTGCDALQFDPGTSFGPGTAAEGGTSQADQPTGATFSLKVPQTNQAGVNATPSLRSATVTLPEGMAVDPSAADGLQACSNAQFGLGSSVEPAEPAECPLASQVGTAEVVTPLLEKPINGQVFIGRPECSPCTDQDAQDGHLFRLFLQLYSPERGVVVKLAGKVSADPATGRLQATFTEQPQLPFSELELKLKGGPRAPLANPQTCGISTTTTDLTPWSAPGLGGPSGTEPIAGTPDAHADSSFDVTEGPGGAACPATLQSRPFKPGLSAGTENPLAGLHSPFVLHLTRNDGEQEFGSIDTTLPAGLTAVLRGVPYCPDSAIAAAASKGGAAEQASPSCPVASQIGTITTGAGAGSDPYHVSGKAYLSGPYKGAPLSLALITPAVAGPFDLGNVVVRAGLYVDPETAQVTVKSDPIPQILDGVPLRIRSIVARIDRPDFTLNPTSCEPMAVATSIAGSSGATASPSNRFQVGGCDNLKFKPKLQISLKGSTKHAGHPALTAVVTYPKQGAYANIARAQVNLPHSEFLDQSNLNKTCTKPVLLAGNCPKSSIYGKAKAWTPLLEKPLEGPVFLVGGYGYKLPALVAELNGQIRVVLKGKVDSGPNKGIRNTFEAVPDAPVEKFVLEMKGGPKYSLLENSEDLCQRPQRAIARFTAQNGAVEQTKPLIDVRCGKKPKGKKKSSGLPGTSRR